MSSGLTTEIHNDKQKYCCLISESVFVLILTVNAHWINWIKSQASFLISSDIYILGKEAYFECEYFKNGYFENKTISKN